jgi:protein-S-isoprenylcysteine O-methyltransferase Ste14
MNLVGRVLDWPPLWLAGALAAAAVLDRLIPLALLGEGGRLPGALLGLAGLALMALAVVRMAAARTTVIPRRAPAALVTGGVFALSRNPIYLGDALVLAGAILWWDAPLALPLIPAFVAIITRRFILGEEAALARAFGPAWQAWSARVPRWIGLPRRGK